MAAVIQYSPLFKNDQLDNIQTEFANGIIRTFGGTPVAIGTTDPGTDILVEFTKDGGAFTAGVATNGINLGTASNGAIEKDANDYEGLGLVAGTQTWFRHYNNDLTKWIQGTVNTSGAAMTVTTTAVVVDQPVAITNLIYRF